MSTSSKEDKQLDLEANSDKARLSKSSKNPLEKLWHPQPAQQPAKFGGQPVPDGSANIWKLLVFSWIDPVMKVGFTRPLEKEGEL